MPLRADAAERDRGRRLALGEELDRVEDLHVAGAAAEVGAEVAGRGRPVEAAALLVEQRLATRTRMPGVQNPHWSAPVAAKARGQLGPARSVDMPSSVVTERALDAGPAGGCS